MKLIPYLIALAFSSLGFSSLAVAADAMSAGANPAIPEAATVTAEPAATTTATTTEATTATTTQAAPQEEEQAGFSRGSVVRSIFTTSIQDREPIDKLEKSAEADRVFYFTELRDMSGQTAIHRWEFDGKVMAEVKFDVRGPRWRVWSSKSFTPGWAGDWKVSVLNGAGETISEEIINMTSAVLSEPAEPAESAASTEPAMKMEAMPAATEEFQPPVNPELLQQ
mgnify:CR=1 FL=1